MAAVFYAPGMAVLTVVLQGKAVSLLFSTQRSPESQFSMLSEQQQAAAFPDLLSLIKGLTSPSQAAPLTPLLPASLTPHPYSLPSTAPPSSATTPFHIKSSRLAGGPQGNSLKEYEA